MRVGVLGGGQLGRMLALGGLPLGLEFLFLDPSAEAPAGKLAPLVCAGFDDESALAELAAGVDVVTCETENVPVGSLEALDERVPVRPAAQAFASAQDRLHEKELFERLGIETADWRPVSSFDELEQSIGELEQSIGELGLPALLKTRRLGYDGRGQRLIRETSEAETAWDGLRRQPSIVEPLVPFERELSLVAVRGLDGKTAFYPLAENRHQDGILRTTVAPARGVAVALQVQAEEWATRLLDELAYVGVLALELFEHGGRLLANELAPRVHNSGHWTIEGAVTSQFENHVRAICGLPLGRTGPLGTSVTINFVGQLPDPAAMLRVPGLSLHVYGRKPAPNWTLGHATLVASEQEIAALEEPISVEAHP